MRLESAGVCTQSITFSTATVHTNLCFCRTPMNPTLTAISLTTLSYTAKSQVTQSTKLKVGFSQVPNASSGICAVSKCALMRLHGTLKLLQKKMTPQAAGCDPAGNKLVCAFWVLDTACSLKIGSLSKLC